MTEDRSMAAGRVERGRYITKGKGAGPSREVAQLQWVLVVVVWE